MASIGTLVVNLAANLKPLKSGLDSAQKNIASFSNGIAGTAVVAGLSAIGAGLVSVAADAEQAQVAFEVMLGSTARAETMLSRLYDMARLSPFGFGDFRQSSQALLQFGVDVNSVLPTVAMLGDIAAGDAEKLQRLSMVFGQMSAAGRLMGQDLLQMVNAGFNPLQEISKKTGESMLELKKRMEAGGISSAEVALAFQAATQEGGRFFGMTDRLSRSTTGKFMALKDEVMLMSRSMGEYLLPAANLVLDAIRGLVSLFSGFAKEIVYAGVAIAALILTVKGISLALIAYSKAMTLAKSLSGPAGWVSLAAGLAVAAVAIGAVDIAMDKVSKTVSESHEPLDTMAKDVAKLGDAFEITKAQQKTFDDAVKISEQGLSDLDSEAVKVNKSVEEFAWALARAGDMGMILKDNPLVQQFREQKAGYTDMLKDVTDEIRILKGEATAAGIALEGMLAAGVDPAKIQALQDLIDKKNQLEEQNKKAEEQKDAADFFKRVEEDMIAQANAIRGIADPLGALENKFTQQMAEAKMLADQGFLSQEDLIKYQEKLQEQLQKDKMALSKDQTDEPTQFASAAVKGSQEAYSAIVRAMTQNDTTSPVVNAINDQKDAVVDAIAKKSQNEFVLVEAIA